MRRHRRRAALRRRTRLRRRPRPAEHRRRARRRGRASRSGSPPSPCDLPPRTMLPFFADCAERAEAVRRGGAEVVFVTGCEISAFCQRLPPGRHATATACSAMCHRRHGLVAVPRAGAWSGSTTSSPRPPRRSRPRFGGRVTYASAPWEFVDWSPFDLVGVDAYRAAYNADTFRRSCAATSSTASPSR